MRRWEFAAFIGVLLLGLVLAFVAGIWVGGSGTAEPGDDRTPQPAATREVYSPKVLDDPWFLDRQRTNVEALERECAERGKLCAEARAARRWLDEQGG